MVAAASEFSTSRKTRLMYSLTSPRTRIRRARCIPYIMFDTIGFLLAIFLLWLYPLCGEYLSDMKETLNRKREAAGA